jgi:2-polyprenyl-6-methoxyphenol hydroxylase-like FAD-dependent oxidoreductase
MRFRDVCALFPDVARRLGNASSLETGAVTAMRTLGSVCNGRCALIGDASGSPDAITGEGLSVAFRQALALALALKSNDLRSYQRAHQQIAHVPVIMSKLLLLLDRHPQLRGRVLRAFAAEPTLFERMLSVHIGAIPATRLGVGTAVSFGRKLLVQSAET